MPLLPTQTDLSRRGPGVPCPSPGAGPAGRAAGDRDDSAGYPAAATARRNLTEASEGPKFPVTPGSARAVKPPGPGRTAAARRRRHRTSGWH
eukprot:759126-Hanusia_phi.AAC.1